jgi:hypothetical protein
MTWVDATFQAVLSAKMLLQMAEVLGIKEDLGELGEEVERLCAYANQNLWNEKNNFYCDRLASGELPPVKHIGAYWALLADCVPEGRMSLFIEHLENQDEFNRTHRIPALSADDPCFSGTGDYWSGGVWAPTNYMVLKGLDATGYKDLAHQIALNHNDRVVRVFESDDTPWRGVEQFRQFFQLTDLRYDDHHTLWENYAPDCIAPGSHSKPGYVGWTGIPPIALLFEDIFGLAPDAPADRLTWHVRLLEEHGMRRYPFGQDGIVDLKCLARRTPLERPQIEIQSNVPFKLEIVWDGGREILEVEGEP